MERIILVHWNDEEAKKRSSLLTNLGYSVEHSRFEGMETLRGWRSDPPDAFVIDLSRLPSHGRDVAVAIRSYKDTRRVPLVFVEGAPEKISSIKEILPDAVCTTWKDISGVIESAIAQPPVDPVKPRSLLEGYSRTPLPKKLGIKDCSRVVLIDSPPDFRETLGTLPEGAQISGKDKPGGDLTLWFVRSRKDLDQNIRRMTVHLEKQSLWIVWPKKSSRLDSDLNQAAVRKAGLENGLVDYKVCSVDETWSGLLFTRRKS